MRYPRLVEIAWDVVSKLVGDWAKNPHYWEKEIDIQAELYSRLTAAYRLVGQGDVMLRSDGKRYRYARVACEPHIPCPSYVSESRQVVPDIVVWKDADGEASLETYWPILWACEIKYGGSHRGDLDKEKLAALVEQKTIDFGCWLSLKKGHARRASDMNWNKIGDQRRLWTCEAIANSDTGTEDIE